VTREPSQPKAARRGRRVRTRRRLVAASAVGIVLVTLAALALIERVPKFHPYVAYRWTDALEVNLLLEPRGDRAQCTAAVERMLKAMRDLCAGCRLIRSGCLDELDPAQQKIVSHRPVDVPVVYTANASVAFLSSNPQFSLQACMETGRQAAQSLPGSSQCVPAGAEGLALAVASVGGRTAVDASPRPNALAYATLLAAAISCLLCYIIVRFQHRHARFTLDRATGPQKFHAAPTPRVGGVAVAVALAAITIAVGALGWLPARPANGLSMLALSALPAFAGGLGEDVTKRVGVLARLMLTISAGVIASLLVGATLDRLDVPGFDVLLRWPLFAVAFTAFAVGGVANAINIIDGYNGLVGGYAILVLAAFAWVAGQVGDSVVLTASLVMLGALAGFLVWNYPKGKLFLGDGGAYLLGFWLAELSVLLVVRNPEVSPWFPMLLLVYPVFETVFSIYRRTFLREGDAGRPDALHLHQLIYTRLVRLGRSRDATALTRRNSAVAGYVWAGSIPVTVAALLMWRSTPALMASAVVFCLAYLWLYRRLVRWHSPAWLIRSGRRA